MKPLTKTPLLQPGKFYYKFSESIGKLVWGDYWNAVKLGFVRTIRHETLSVNIRKTLQGGEWISFAVEWRNLETKVKESRHFGMRDNGGYEKAYRSAVYFRDSIIAERAIYLKGLSDVRSISK